ncbi:PEP-CTERM sorting domain-containing protein [Crocosphaera sp. UHCC 0190]|uniref:PEP-CTERM sorting domain-containing protein n=1 Tax=Crocosphaera sp. UHCC 0190 TaxID=3110246 RepID=UPI002B213EE5|nr:PEP-CTERM sorting domain-containing protein [Crocosphaera sp. UHCC 0190]MEA5511600.1 PEP-CTERM sorting domain-containing protein [Crocosphaera sp. UHCC 0190]
MRVIFLRQQSEILGQIYDKQVDSCYLIGKNALNCTLFQDLMFFFLPLLNDMKNIVVSLPLCLATMAAILGVSSQAQAGSLTTEATNSGTYLRTGSTTFTKVTGTNGSGYLTGRVVANQENRSYFVFTIDPDMSKANRTILSAVLTLANPNPQGADLSTGRTLSITNVTTAINTLTTGGTNTVNQGVFNDLGVTGTGNQVYGTTTVASTPVVSSVAVNLNQNNILTTIKNRAGAQLAFGSAITLNGTAVNQSIFSGTTASNSRQLTINFADAFLGTNGNQQFGNILIGQSNNKTVTLTNTGEVGSTLTGAIGPSSDPTILSSLSPGQTVNFSLASGASQDRTFIYTPTVRGSNQTTIGVLSNDIDTNILFTGRGVAPENEILQSNTNVGDVRIGTSKTATVQVQNIGDGNTSGQAEVISNLNGTSSLGGSSVNFQATSGSAGNFSLTDNQTRNFDIVYTPTTHGTESELLTLAFTNGSDDGTNQSQTKNFSITGTGVGPAFQSGSPPNSTLDFGQVDISKTKMLDLVVSNVTQDESSVESLTGLTILNAFFEGPDADLFSLLNFMPGVVIAKGNSLPLQVLFNAQSNGSKNAILRIVTDQGVAFQQVGDSFTYNLTATAVPEPSSLLGMGIFVTTGMLLKRKRHPFNKG